MRKSDCINTESDKKNKNNKQGKSLYQRLRELPLSKDGVGQSFIIVRGGHIIKPKSKSSKPGKNKDS